MNFLLPEPLSNTNFFKESEKGGKGERERERERERENADRLTKEQRYVCKGEKRDGEI
jgi:hypothetical protein